LRWQQRVAEGGGRMLWRANHVVAALVASPVRPVRLAGAPALQSAPTTPMEGDPVYYRTELSGPIVEVAVRENQSVSRASSCPGSTPALPHGAGQDRAEIEIPASPRSAASRPVGAPGARTSRRAKPAELRPGRYDRQEDLADRKFAPAAKMEESRMGFDVARQRIASAEEDLQHRRRRWPAIPRSSPTIIPR